MTLGLAFLLAALAAGPQYAARSAAPIVPGLARTASPGSFQMGADSCAAPHTYAGTGDVTGVPFATGSTGATGQNESACQAFGGTGIDADVWFDWTATVTGNARLATCGGTIVDTKIAVWPDHSPASCPPDGTSLGCNEDLCGLQSSVTWPVTAGTTYTLQIGTFPGAAGGSGTFSVTQSPPPPCGQLDDGSSESAYGLVAGGELGWLHRFACLAEVDEVRTAYGTPLFPGSVTNGSGSRIAVWDDLDGDGDPSTGTLLKSVVSTVVVNGDTDVLNAVPLGSCIAIAGDLWVGATANQLAGEFPAPMDLDDPTPEAWVVGSTLGPGTLNLASLAANPLPPARMSTLGVDTAWLLRAGDASCNVPELATLELSAIEGARESAVGNFAQLADPHAPGRLFLDTVAGGALLATPDEQYVELTVQIGPAGVDPTHFEVRWEARDPDDPATHPDVDPNDGGPGGTPTGGDNFDALPTESGVPRDFFAMADHAIGAVASPGSDPGDPDRVIGRATTQLDASGRSSVRFHHGDEGGDDYVLRAVCVRKADGVDVGSDESGVLTVWRRRDVRLDMMEKPADDVQLIPVGGAGASPTTPCVGGGANGVVDTFLAGDDRYGGLDGRWIEVGPNLVCDTAAGNGGLAYLPDTNFNALVASLRASFASTDGDRALYIDPVVSFGINTAAHEPALEPALGKNRFSGEHAYARDHTPQHLGGGDAHPRNAFHLIGVRTMHDAYDARTGNRLADGRVDPHAYVDVLRHYQLFQASGQAFLELRHTCAHLLAHQAVPELTDDLHGPHSAAPYGTCCGDPAPGQGALWCPRHARRIRENVARAWPDHTGAVADPRESERDSD